MLGVPQDGDNLPLYNAIFPARLTAVETDGDGLNTYSFVEQKLSTADEYEDADLAREGSALELNNRLLTITDPGELVWMRFRTVEEGEEEYEFFAGVDASDPYGDLVGLQSTDCLTAVGPSDSVILTYSGGVWTSTDELTYPGDTGIVAFWFAGGSLHCSLETTSCGARELLNLGNGCFRGGPLTGHGEATGEEQPPRCVGETFTVCLACGPCPQDIPTIDTVCCPDDLIPSRLYATITSGGPCDGTYTLDWDGTTYWSSYVGSQADDQTIGDCFPGYLFGVPNMRMACVGPLWSMTLGAGSGFTQIPVTCSPFSIVFQSTVATPGPCGCDAALDEYTITVTE